MLRKSMRLVLILMQLIMKELRTFLKSVLILFVKPSIGKYTHLLFKNWKIIPNNYICSNTLKLLLMQV